MSESEKINWAETIYKEIRELRKNTDIQLRFQRFANLGPDRNVTINHRGEAFQIHVPFGDIDYIQKVIIANRAFYEAGKLQKLSELNLIPQGGIIIDAGANIGNHSVYFGHFFKPSRMYCFEPQNIAFQTLLKNIELNLSGCDVRTHQALLGADAGFGSLKSYKHYNHGGATFEASNNGNVPMLTLDDTIDFDDQNKVSFIKIDVERAQDDVLRGAKKILEISKPTLWIEVFPDERTATDALLSELGYEPETLHNNDILYKVA